MTDTQAKNIYFLGIGGIGMSAIARYYARRGPGGRIRPDRNRPHARSSPPKGPTSITRTTRPASPPLFRNPDDTLVVYTPAIPTTTPKRPGSAAAASVC